jgi:hypothetical protein
MNKPLPDLPDRLDYFVKSLMERAAVPGPDGEPDLELGGLAIALGMVANQVKAGIAQLTEERDLAVAHDRQPYPTAWAYEQACKARTAHQERADTAEATVARVQAEVSRIDGLPALDHDERADSFATGARWTLRLIHAALTNTAAPTPTAPGGAR